MKTLLKITLLLLLITTCINIAWAKECPELAVAIQKGDTERTIKFIKDGCDVNDNIVDNKDWSTKTPLMYASEEGNLEIVKLLISKGANVNARTKRNWTALMLASGSGYTKIVKLLIEKGAELDVRDKGGGRAITNAKEKGHNEIVKLLKEAGATE